MEPTVMETSKKRKQRKVKNLVCRGGVWQVRKKVGNQIVRVSTHQTDLVLAEKAARAILHKIDKGELDEFIGRKRISKVLIPTYGDFVQTYLVTVSSLKKASTARADAFTLARSVKAFGTKQLDTVTPLDCLELLATLKAKGLTQNTVLLTMTLSIAVFRVAVANKLVKENPWSAIPRAARPKRKARTRVASDVEFDQMYAELPTKELKAITMALRFSGLRIGEFLQLVPAKHLDFVNGYVELTDDMELKSGPRSVPMEPEAREAFVELIGNRGLKSDELLARGYDSKEEVERGLAAACDELKIARIHPHDLRRTYGTRHAEAGVPMHILKMWMGHKNITVTAQFYAHSDKAAGKRISMQFAAQRRPATKVTDISAQK